VANGKEGGEVEMGKEKWMGRQGWDSTDCTGVPICLPL